MIKQFKGIKFDDYLLKYDEDTNDWSQVCEECTRNYGFTHPLVTGEGEGSGICGVQGCENEADRYIDFPDGELIDAAE